jgi:hypothetical protein
MSPRKRPGSGGEAEAGLQRREGKPDRERLGCEPRFPERSGPRGAEGSVRRASTKGNGATSVARHPADGCVQGETLRRVVRPWERIPGGSTADGMADPHVPPPVGRSGLETGRTPGSAPGCNKPAGQCAEQAVEVGRNDKDGRRRWSGRPLHRGARKRPARQPTGRSARSERVRGNSERTRKAYVDGGDSLHHAVARGRVLYFGNPKRGSLLREPRPSVEVNPTG